MVGSQVVVDVLSDDGRKYLRSRAIDEESLGNPVRVATIGLIRIYAMLGKLCV